MRSSNLLFILLASSIFAFYPLAYAEEESPGKSIIDRVVEKFKAGANPKDKNQDQAKKAKKKSQQSSKDVVKKLPPLIKFNKQYLKSIKSGVTVLSEKAFNDLAVVPAIKPISYIVMDGTINPGNASFVETSIKHAKEKGHQALIMRMDTPGGLLSSTRDIVRYISEAKIPVIVFVHPGGARATSAGAIISIASHVVAMSPGTNIGAAAPVATGKNLEGDLQKKAKNDTAAMVKAQSNLRGRNTKMAELIVRESSSLTAEEAKTQKLIEYTPSNVDDLLRSLHRNQIRMTKDGASVVLNTAGLTESSLVRLKMNASQKFLHLVANPNISTLLMGFGGMGLYAEISSGFTLLFPGVFGVICLILAFVSLQTLPINVGGLILFGLGMVLIMAEAFVSTFGLLSLGGIISLGIGALFLVDTTKSDIQVSMSIIAPILAALAIIMGLVSYIIARDRKSSTNSSFDPLLGKNATILEISDDGRTGKAFVQGEIWQFRSNEPFSAEDIGVVKGQDGMILEIERYRKEITCKV